MKALLQIGACAACVAAMDLFWVGWAMHGFYLSRLGHLMADRAYWPAAIGFYLVYPAGVWFFASYPAGSVAEAAARGAALGFLVYAVYNFTNMALLKSWPWPVTLVDIAWGAVLTAAAAAAGYAAGGSA